MYYVLVHFPDIDFSKINYLRKKYDPTYRIIDPHITLMFPVPDYVGEENLWHHLERILNNVNPFTIHLKGFVKSWDHWLFMTLKTGNSEVIQLYDSIYSDMLSSYKRSDVTFIPHIGLGLFVKNAANYTLLDPKELEFDQKGYRRALQEAETLGLNYRSILDRASLLKLNHDLSKIIWRKEIYITDENA